MNMSTGELETRLQRHYIKPGAPLPGGIFLPEVGWNPASYRGGCDAIYVGFTSTSGRLLVGHELKVSRGDWLKELKSPGKADGWADECHEWWLVVNDPAIVHDGELPAGWGLMSPTGPSKTRMAIQHKADRKGSNHQPSWHAVRSIMARQDTLRAAAIAKVGHDADQRAWAKYESQVNDRSDRLMGADRAHLDAAREHLAAVEKALGASIDWSERAYGRHNAVTLKDIEAIASLVRAHGTIDRAVEELTGRYASPTAHTRRSLDKIDEALAEISKLRASRDADIIDA
jgi:hypothetical protein